MMTYPSIKNQTCQNYTWLIFTSPDLPEEYSKKLDSYADSSIKIIRVNTFQEMKEYVNNIIKNEKSYATVWLDDDDGLSPNFLMNVNKYENETGKIVSFPIGIDYTVINNTLLYGKNRDFKNIALGITAIGFNIFMVPGCHTKFNTIREVIYDYTPESYYVCCSEFCNTKRKFHQKEGVPTNIS